MRYARMIGSGVAGLLCIVLEQVTLAAPSGAVTTPAVACTAPANRVQRFVCNDPEVRALDAEMAAVYVDALQRNAARRELLEIDQRNWLAERDSWIFALLKHPPISMSGLGGLAQVYRDRIDFLRRAGEAASAESPLLARLDQSLSTLDAGVVEDRLSALGARRAPRYGTELIDSVLGRVPGDPEAGLQGEIDRLDRFNPHWMEPVWLEQAGIGGVYRVEGTAHCTVWLMFERHGTQLRSIPVPGTLSGNCNLENGDLALIGDHVVAVRVAADALTPTLVWQVQPWNGDGGWGEPASVMARFDHVLSVAAATCALGVDCTSVRSMALDFARRYDREPLPSTLADPSLPASERAAYERLRALAASSEVASKLPQIDTRVFSGLDGFGADSSFFPVRLGGEWVLGRIGHGHIGWREAGGWLVGFWKLDGDDLVPLAGVVVASDAGRFLIAAPVTAVVHRY